MEEIVTEWMRKDQCSLEGFFVRGRKVEWKKIRRYINRETKKNADFLFYVYLVVKEDERGVLSPDIEYRTPPNGSSANVSTKTLEDQQSSAAYSTPYEGTVSEKSNPPPAKRTKASSRSHKGCW